MHSQQSLRVCISFRQNTSLLPIVPKPLTHHYHSDAY